MKTLKISGEKDRATIVAILAQNGYTVRIVTLKEGNKTERVVQYETTPKTVKREEE